MNYFLFKLRFDTPVHFGASDTARSLDHSEEIFRADTLFSALCHTALTLYGPDGVEKLLTWAKSGQLILSDSMPWRDQELFLPKPCIPAQAGHQLPAHLQKLIKKLSWIPVSAIDNLQDFFQNGTLYDPAKFGSHSEGAKAALHVGEDTLPYPVGLFSFDPNCGLYFLAGCSQEQFQYLSRLLTGLGMSGIGGKVSAGYGKFSLVKAVALEETEDSHLHQLNQALNCTKASRYLLLTTSLPAEHEIETAVEDACFRLVRRSGFVQSDTYAKEGRKKRTQYFLGAGAVLRQRFLGDVYEVGSEGTHSVFRYSRPMLLGVEL